MLKKMVCALVSAPVRRRVVLLGVSLSLVLVLFLVACAGPASTHEPIPAPEPTPAPNPAPTPTPTPTVPPPSGPIEGVWIDSVVSGEAVSIPLSDLEKYWNVHFKVNIEDGEMTFMAYIYDGDVQVRGNVCPPCRSIGYALDDDKGILICDMCATLFEADTGAGISGACVDYPKSAVPYEITGDLVVMEEDDLAFAYRETLLPG